jgi:hypothetical protein
MTPLLHPLPLRFRATLAALAFIGTALYAASFILHPEAGRLVPIATAIGLSAGLSWMVLGKVILYIAGRSGPKIMMWFDTCLLTMAAGELVLLTAALANLIAHFTGHLIPAWAHLGLLLLSDLVMASVFIIRAALLGTSPQLATALWIAVLNGAFAVFMVAFALIFGFA